MQCPPASLAPNPVPSTVTSAELCILGTAEPGANCNLKSASRVSSWRGATWGSAPLSPAGYSPPTLSPAGGSSAAGLRTLGCTKQTLLAPEGLRPSNRSNSLASLAPSDCSFTGTMFSHQLGTGMLTTTPVPLWGCPDHQDHHSPNAKEEQWGAVQRRWSHSTGTWAQVARTLGGSCSAASSSHAGHGSGSLELLEAATPVLGAGWRWQSPGLWPGPFSASGLSGPTRPWVLLAG